MKIIDKIKQIEKYICENFEEWDLEDPVEEEYLVDYHEISGASETEIVSFVKKYVYPCLMMKKKFTNIKMGVNI